MTTTTRFLDFLAILKRLSKSAGFAGRGNAHGDQRSKMTDVLPFKQAKLTIFSLRVFPLVYMATPYSRYPGGIQKAFEDASRLAGRLVRNGVRVYSPIAHTHPIAVYGDINPLDHTIWIPFDESMMRVSSALLVAEMEGWKHSRGIEVETGIFIRDGKPVYYINPNSLEVRQ